MASYYTQIRGTTFDRALLDKAAELQEGKGDGRISKADAKPLAAKVSDAGVRTDVEDRTVRKIYRDANFTPAGRAEFSRLNRSSGQSRRNTVASMIEARKLQQF